MSQVKVFAPATVANVACGFDVLGLALDYPGDEVLVTKTDQEDIVITACHNAENLPLAADKNVAGVAVRALLDKLGSNQGFEIELTKGVKPGSGIGSSAASSAAAVGSTVAAIALELNQRYNSLFIIIEIRSARPVIDAGFCTKKRSTSLG